MTTGLVYENSDLDLAICGSHIKSRESLNTMLLKLSYVLSENEFILSCQPIITAQVPLIKLNFDLSKFTTRKLPISNLKVDITFDTEMNEFFFGIQCTDFIQHILYQFNQLKPLVIILKKMLNKAELNNSYLGGMNSCNLTLLVYAFLNTSNSFENNGQALLNLLEYFGKIFDINTMAIINNFIILNNNIESALFISDPILPQLNAAKNVTKFSEIQSLFLKIFNSFSSICTTWQTGESILHNKSLLSIIYPY